MRFFEQMNQSKAHPGFTFLYHYNEYAESRKNPYDYNQFIEHYWYKFPKEKGSMKLEHKVGNEAFIDFARKKLHKETEEQIGVEVFAGKCTG